MKKLILLLLALLMSSPLFGSEEGVLLKFKDEASLLNVPASLVGKSELLEGMIEDVPLQEESIPVCKGNPYLMGVLEKFVEREDPEKVVNNLNKKTTEELIDLWNLQDFLSFKDRKLDKLIINNLKQRALRREFTESDSAKLENGSYVLKDSLWRAIYKQSQICCTNTLSGHNNGVRSVAFSPDGKKLASGSGDETIKLWNTKTGACTNTLSGHNNGVRSVAFSPDGEKLASGSDDNTIKLWNTQKGECTNTLSEHEGWVRSVAFSPDGEKLASGSDDNTIKLWNTKTGVCTNTLSGHRSMVFSVAFSPDGEKLASGSLDSTIKLWNVITGSYMNTLEGHSSKVFSVAFSPDGEKLASGSLYSKVKLWDIITGACTNTLEGQSGGVFSVAFRPDGEKLASGANNINKTIKLWNTKTGACTNTLEGQSGGVFSVAFSPDGKKLASGEADKTIKLWGNIFEKAGVNLSGIGALSLKQVLHINEHGTFPKEIKNRKEMCILS